MIIDEYSFYNHFRAKYINQSARQILDRGGETWLRSLRGSPYDEAKKELMALNGVGAKVNCYNRIFSSYK
jgi:endonuclease III